MSRFYGTIENNRSELTKCGHKDGLKAHVRGWDVGVYVDCFVSDKGVDTLRVYRTGGSNHPENKILIAELE